MKSPQIFHGEFFRRALRRPGVERIIEAREYRGHRYLQIALVEGGRSRGGSQIRPENAEVILAAIERARTSTANQPIGSYEDGRFTIEVRVGRHPAGGTAVFLEKIDANGHDAGRAIALFGDELPAMEAGLAWLVEDLI